MPRILVVDDSADLRDTWQALLQDEGYEVTTAADGAEALALHREEPVDLVITDILMPESDGLDVIAEIKLRSPTVKIIAVSGGGIYVEKGLCLHLARKMGVNKALVKPVDWGALRAAVAELTADPEVTS